MSWCLLLLCLHAEAHANNKRPLTVADAIETARILSNPDAVRPENPDGAVSISPDGSRYVARLIRGDIKKNGVWAELITGRLDSLAGAARYETVARLFTSGLGTGDSNFGPFQDTEPYAARIRWLDNDRVTFLWSNESGARQLVLVRLSARQVEFLTDHPTSLVGFDINGSGRVLYNAQARTHNGTAEMLRDGFVVPQSTDAASLFRGDLGTNGFDRAFNTEWFFLEEGAAEPRKFTIAGRDIDPDYRHGISFSPNGEWAVIDAAPTQVPTSWDAYTNPDVRAWVADARRDPGLSTARTLHQLYVVDVKHETSRPLWGAMTLSAATSTEWSADGLSLLLAPTHLPVEGADARGLAGRAVAVVDVASGRYEQLPIDLPAIQPPVGLRWLGADEVEVTTRGRAGTKRSRFQRLNTQWQAVPASEAREEISMPLRIEVRESITTPPKVIAVEVVSGKERLLVDPNPELLSRYSLGRVERVEGKLESGEQWEGLLFYPLSYRPGHRYPMVIQSQYGAIGSKFTLYGAGTTGPAATPPYAGQLLANREIAVLHLNVRIGQKFNTTAEAETRRIAFERTAEHFIAKGLVDPQKVGLLGFSRNGYYVEYTLTHSSFPFAAAIAADNWDPSYFQQILSGDTSAAMVNGAEPFDEGLDLWLKNAPGFNVHRVHTPLRMVEQSLGLFGVLAKWEIFSRLRYLKKPVEFYVAPDTAHGAHTTQNPRQIMAIQQGTIDWFDFWLNGREDASPQKAQQYEQWRELRKLHEADLK